jgi:hypothetical protein
VHKRTDYKFSKLLRLSISALIGKELKDLFYSQMSPQATQSSAAGNMLPASYGLKGCEVEVRVVPVTCTGDREEIKKRRPLPEIASDFALCNSSFSPPKCDVTFCHYAITLDSILVTSEYALVRCYVA